MKKSRLAVVLVALGSVAGILFLLREKLKPSADQSANSEPLTDVQKQVDSGAKPIETANQQSGQKSSDSKTGNFFQIKELGIQFPIDAGLLNDLTYVVSASPLGVDSDAKTVVLSSKRLAALGCNPQDGFMLISRGKDSESDPNFHPGGRKSKALSDGSTVTFQQAQASCWGDGKNGYTEEKGKLLKQTSDKVFSVIDEVSVMGLTNEGSVYENPDFGFQFSVPKEWGAYKVMIENGCLEKGLTVFNFIFPVPESDGAFSVENCSTHEKYNQYSFLFSVFAWDRDLWERKMKSKPCENNTDPVCPRGFYQENEKYVFDIVRPPYPHSDDEIAPTVDKLRSSDFTDNLKLVQSK